jgi:hypothetical protein
MEAGLPVMSTDLLALSFVIVAISITVNIIIAVRTWKKRNEYFQKG